MKRKMTGAVLITILCTAVFAAHPQGIGLGLMGGDPSGFSAKIWTGPHTAFDAGLGYSYWWYGQALQVHGDALWHSRSLIQAENGYLPLYFGLGARIKLADRARELPDMRVGLRIPFGVEYVFTEIPVGLFLELVPVIDLVPGMNFGGNSSVGIRYYFSSLAED